MVIVPDNISTMLELPYLVARKVRSVNPRE